MSELPCDAPGLNAIWAAAFLDELAQAGVRDVSISPGSRSTPLVLACARDGRFRTFVHLDERSAGFFALGSGKATGQPALVITTSGTAAANLYPAVVEAFQSEVPLLVATADRPHRFRGADANQTIDQLRLFGAFTRAFFEVSPPDGGEAALRHLRALASRSVGLAVGLPGGPVHLNFPFPKPLEPGRLPVADGPSARSHPAAGPGAGRADGRPWTRIPPSRLAVDPAEVDRIAELLRSSARGVLVAGPTTDPARSGPAMRALAEVSGLPLLADPLSGARFGGPGGAPLLVSTHDLFLRESELRRSLAPDFVLRVGAAPTSASLTTFLDESERARHVVIDGGARWKDHLSRMDDYVRADIPDFLLALADRLAAGGGGAVATAGAGSDADAGAGGAGAGGGAGSAADPASGWLRAWCEAEAATRRIVEKELEGPFFEGTILRAVTDEVEADEVLFISSSMPIRDLDSFGAPGSAPFAVHANRGASGIDGIVSTALGVAAGGGRRVVAVLGDVAFHHDMNGLLATREAGLDVTFVLIHNDGGGIFHMLPIREHEPDFTPYFATPHGLDFSHAAALFKLPFTRVQDADGLRDALERARAESGCRIIEVTTDREENRLRHEEVVAAVRSALAR